MSETDERKPPPTTIAVDAVAGVVAIVVRQGESSSMLSMDAAAARELAAAIASRASEAYVQALELQLAAAKREIAELRQATPTPKE